MIKVSFTFGGNGLIQEIESKGHAKPGEQGTSLVCGIISANLKLFLEWLVKIGVQIQGDASLRGVLKVKFEFAGLETIDKVYGATSYLEYQIKELSEKFPQELVYKRLIT